MIYEDLEPRKQAVIEHLKLIGRTDASKTNTYSVGLGIQTQYKPTEEEWAELDRLCSHLRTNHDKLIMLLKSQLMSGNVQGAIKVVQGTQGRRFNAWGHLLVSPVTIPIAIVAWVLLVPARLIRWIASNS